MGLAGVGIIHAHQTSEPARGSMAGTETINGVETYHVKGADNDGNPEEYWFKTDTFFFVKGTFRQKSSDASLTGTTTVTHWNGKVTIAIPNV